MTEKQLFQKPNLDKTDLTYVPLYYAIVGSFQYKVAAAFFAGDGISSFCTFKMLNLLTSRAF